jgi:phosphonoacetaldehyde hydrolase
MTHVTAVVFDWAGTTVDHGSRAPAIAFQELFRRKGIEITGAQAREPMGMAKRDHIAAIAAMPAVENSWCRFHGRPFLVDDLDVLYQEFLPLQEKTLRQHSDIIAGVAAAVEDCRRMGLKIGSSTGYTRALMEIVIQLASQQGYQPDCVICAEDAPRGRPAPFLLYEAAKRLDVYPLWTIVNVDDTPVGITAGRHAGCWSIGVTRTGNCVGLSPEEVDALPKNEVHRLCTGAARRLDSAGAHYTIESVADIVPVLLDIDRRLARGEIPIWTSAIGEESVGRRHPFDDADDAMD